RLFHKQQCCQYNKNIFSHFGLCLGEYYRIHYPQEHQSTKIISSSLENELLPLEAIKRDLQKGDGNTNPTKLNNIKREGETSGRRVSVEGINRTDHRSFENGATSCSELVKKHHFKGVKKKKWISEEPRNLSNTVTGKENHTSNPKVKPSYQQSDKRKDDETASSISVRQARRNTYFNSSEPRRSAYVFYRNVTDVQEPKFNGSMDKYTSGSCNAPTWRKRNPHAKTFTKFKTTIQSQEEMEMNIKGERFVERRKI
uniref:Chromosome 12 open reading frame 50 n=1 Tax=Anas zonorhyncha TaxID=75864 RepID=A0A8B9ZQX9_9AVES